MQHRNTEQTDDVEEAEEEEEAQKEEEGLTQALQAARKSATTTLNEQMPCKTLFGKPEHICRKHCLQPVQCISLRSMPASWM